MNREQIGIKFWSLCHGLSRRGVILLGSSLLLLSLLGVTVTQCGRKPAETVVVQVLPPTAPLLAPLDKPVRALPDRFPRDTYLPKKREGDTSGSIDLETFSAGRDLCYVDDARAWWESDNDTGDTECDHSMHYAMERPLRRLIELVHAESDVLKVQDAYRDTGIHNSRSLHREGRALDLTCQIMDLEHLAKLCWASGFDWVYHEASGSGGAHIHVSVRRNHNDNEIATRLTTVP